MSILADTGYVYALYNSQDAHHQQAEAFAKGNNKPTLLPAVILPELGFLFRRDFSIFKPRHCEFFELLP